MIKNYLMQKIIIAIDGVAGSGKGTTARLVARKLGYIHIDSGAMYRVVALYFLQQNIDIQDKNKVFFALKNIKIKFVYDENIGKNDIFLNGNNVEKEIRKEYISDYVFRPAQLPEIREFLILEQQKLGKEGGIVMDGRDIGKIVFPDAKLKIYLLADLEIRALRRWKELKKNGNNISLDDVKNHFRKRDFFDKINTYKCDDALVIDTTNISIDQQVKIVVDLAENIIYG